MAGKVGWASGRFDSCSQHHLPCAALCFPYVLICITFSVGPSWHRGSQPGDVSVSGESLASESVSRGPALRWASAEGILGLTSPCQTEASAPSAAGYVGAECGRRGPCRALGEQLATCSPASMFVSKSQAQGTWCPSTDYVV